MTDSPVNLTPVRKINMLTLVPLCFLFVWILPADSMVVPFSFSVQQTDQAIPLSMVYNSVDDMYYGCHQAMMKIWSKYFQKEMKDKLFAGAWFNARKCAQKKPRAEDKALTIAHMQAICVYTSNDLYQKFNDAVRTQRPVYNTKFKFHSLHFLLTSAIQILNSRNHCYTTYRRTKHIFIGYVNQMIRFGSFASSSFRTDLTQFGSETCFKIRTCFGAYLKNYPTFGESEREVLIPPYEKFIVTKKIYGPSHYKGLRDCKLVYELESARVLSTLNCKAVNP